MKIYRVHLTYEAGTSAGYLFFTRLGEADRAIGGWKAEADHHDATLETIEASATRDGIMCALRIYASHPDNG